MRLLLLLLCLPAAALAKIQVVATMPDLAALAAEVGGEHVHVTALAKPTEDPHFVDARPSFLVPLSRADLVIVNGLELEVGWVPPLLVSARNANIQPGGTGYFDASTALQSKLEVPGSVDRAQGDVHAGGNPHYTLDPRAAAQVAHAIGAHLQRLDPENAAFYAQRAHALTEALQAFAAEQQATFAALPPARRTVVTYHRSWTYFLDWLGLTAAIEIEPRPGIPPTPAHTAQVVEKMRAGAVKVVLQESYYPSKTSETVARLAGGAVVSVTAQTDFDAGQTYLAHMKALTDEVARALAR